MPTSGSCPRSSAGHAARGFSLLEVLIVLVLVSIMVALVSPRLAGTVRAIESSGERAELVRQLQSLPLLARNQGDAIRFARGDALEASPLLQVPEGWSLQATTEVAVAANGICGPARLRVQHGELVEEWSLAVPDCRVDSGDE